MGDPSGRLAEREPMSAEQAAHNLEGITRDLRRVFDNARTLWGAAGMLLKPSPPHPIWWGSIFAGSRWAWALGVVAPYSDALSGPSCAGARLFHAHIPWPGDVVSQFRCTGCIDQCSERILRKLRQHLCVPENSASQTTDRERD